MLHLFLLM